MNNIAASANFEDEQCRGECSANTKEARVVRDQTRFAVQAAAYWGGGANQQACRALHMLLRWGPRTLQSTKGPWAVCGCLRTVTPWTLGVGRGG